MADPQTPNKLLAQPLHNTDVDTWATPINNNTTTIDNSFGGTATIAVSSSPVTLSSSQWQCAFLRFTGTLNANVAITLPTIGGWWTVRNDATNSSAFIITMATTASGGQQIGLPRGITEIYTNIVDVKFRNLPPVGTYVHIAGSSVPAWLQACTVPPYIVCAGLPVSSATYPVLSAILNSSVSPDLRGRSMIWYNDGTGRIIANVYGGVDGNTLYSGGGGQSITLSSAHLPNISFPVTDPGHTHTATCDGATGTGGTTGGGSTGGYTSASTITINSAFTGISVNSGGSNTSLGVMPVSIVGGFTMIRAA